jgi:hypothetical protein
MSVPARREGADLLSLSSAIEREHDAAQRSFRAAVDHAIRCGELLTEAKAQVGHGVWGQWVRENFPASERTARDYMRLANGYRNRQPTADLTIAEALNQIKPPKVKCPYCKNYVRKGPHNCPALDDAGRPVEDDFEVTGELSGLPIVGLQPEAQSKFHRQRIDKAKERVYKVLSHGLTIILASAILRDGSYYEHALAEIVENDGAEEWRKKIAEAKAELEALDEDLRRVLRSRRS